MSNTASKTKSQLSSRDQLRSQIFSGSKSRFRRKTMKLFGADVEIRQPELRTVLEAQNFPDRKQALMHMLVSHCFVPGTEERVFEDADYDQVMQLPFGNELIALNEVIADLTGINVIEQEKNSVATATSTT